MFIWLLCMCPQEHEVLRIILKGFLYVLRGFDFHQKVVFLSFDYPIYTSQPSNISSQIYSSTLAVRHWIADDAPYWSNFVHNTDLNFDFDYRPNYHLKYATLELDLEFIYDQKVKLHFQLLIGKFQATDDFSSPNWLNFF